MKQEITFQGLFKWDKTENSTNGTSFRDMSRIDRSNGRGVVAFVNFVDFRVFVAVVDSGHKWRSIFLVSSNKQI